MLGKEKSEPPHVGSYRSFHRNSVEARRVFPCLFVAESTISLCIRLIRAHAGPIPRIHTISSLKNVALARLARVADYGDTILQFEKRE